MTKAEKIGNYIKKLQNLPDKQKQIILWSVVGFIGLFMLIFWVRGAMNTFNEYFK